MATVSVIDYEEKANKIAQGEASILNNELEQMISDLDCWLDQDPEDYEDEIEQAVLSLEDLLESILRLSLPVDMDIITEAHELVEQAWATLDEYRKTQEDKDNE
jgi:hypothetical protein